MNIQHIQGLIEYGRSVAQEFQARMDRIRSFVPQHNLTSGTANEAILRSFLAELSPKRFKVGQGFICNPTELDQVSKQCDILVFDQSDYPLVHSEGDVQVVWPESVRTVIEVKTELDGKSLPDAIENIVSAKRIESSTIMLGLIFAFKSTSADTCISHLQNYSRTFEMYHAPNAILLLEEKTIITSDKILTPLEANDSYKVWRTRDEGAVLIYLLLLFLYKTSSSIGSSILNALIYLRDNEMKLVSDNLRIGDKGNGLA